MIIKRTINFYPNKEKERSGNAPLRCYVRFNGQTLTINLGYNVNLNGWNADTQRCKKNTFHDKQNISANEINKVIGNCEDLVNSCFEHFEALEQIPTKQELKDLIDIKTGKKKEEAKNNDSFLHLYNIYYRQGYNSEKWTDGTKKLIINLRNLITKWNKDLLITDFDKPSIVEKLISFFVNDCEHNNNTIKRRITAIKTFLHWCIQNQYIDNSYFLSYKVELKTPKKPIIFLSWDELMRVYNHDFSKSPHLNNVRDVFCFCCFTSLRYSDVANLKRSNIKEDSIVLTTIKTADTIEIELNKYSKAILTKYKEYKDKKGHVLPVISNQKMNEYLKDVAKACEIDSPVTITSYKGTQREEVTIPKYDLISSHAGRRTFISNAIMLGIPPEIVMKWSGHSDYQAMKPYIEIANEARRKEMNKFDKIFTPTKNREE